jgi:hypothetical protein
MIRTRTESMDEKLQVADDVVETVFGLVIKRIIERTQMPQDIVDDNLPAGNKAS